MVLFEVNNFKNTLKTFQCVWAAVQRFLSVGFITAHELISFSRTEIKIELTL